MYTTEKHDSHLHSVVFVHGLTGSRETTWTASKDNTKCFWLRDILAKDLPYARILSWGYDANVVNRKMFGKVSKNSISQHANNLCLDLKNFRTHSQTMVSTRASMIRGSECPD